MYIILDVRNPVKHEMLTPLGHILMRKTEHQSHTFNSKRDGILF